MCDRRLDACDGTIGNRLDMTVLESLQGVEDRLIGGLLGAL